MFTVTALHEMSEFSGAETSSWVAELKGPQEVGGLLEVGADSEDLVDQILHAHDAVLAEAALDEGVVSEGNALLVDLSVSTLVDELTDGLQVGVSISDPWLDDLQHLQGGLGHADEDTVVDLEKTEELKDLARLGCNLVDTTLWLVLLCQARASVNSPLDTNNEDQFLFSWDVEGAILLRQTVEADLLALCVTVLLDVLLGTLEDDTAFLLLSLLTRTVSLE